ncbi:RNA polymerase I-associated factor PAF67-domain-containing protein [Spinellus fusiger]|nr:RNA polymerase I-associated factor PAF67-domain-containing protein [Spinellus fusiger]
MYQDTFEEDDLVAEVELVAQARYTHHSDIEDSFDEVSVQQQPSTTQIPDTVRNFILHFYRNVLENNVYELHNIYDSSFNKLTDKFYTKQAWPDAESISSFVNDDQVFLTLYRELYYRHIYARLTPTLEHRFHSYENYCDLFNYILNSEGPVNLELPNPWLWDIIDEFIYQFQSFSIYRDRSKNKTEQEIALLRANPQIWSCYSVLNVLYSFIQKSRINDQLLVSKNGGDMMESAGEYGSRPLYKMLGYFSIVGLLRVHCLLGDYMLALKMMDNIVLNKKAMFARVTACHVTTYYYVGFSYMMMRRYADAVKAFSTVLAFIQRTKQYHARSYQFDQIAKKGDQMYGLLAICIALSPTRLDENIHSQLREKHGEQLFKMQKGEDALSVYEDLWQHACPKFIAATGVNLDKSETDQLNDPHANQLKIFLSDISNQTMLSTLRSFMKLYTTMGIDKLAKFLEVDAEELKVHLLVLKQKSRQFKWTQGNLLEGEYMPTSDLDFCLKQDVVHIAESKIGRRYADWFLRNINRFEDIVATLEQKA